MTNAIPVAPEYVQRIARYIPGKPIEELARELHLDPATIVKLASNENPRGPSPKVLAAIAAAAADVTRYPDGYGYLLKDALAARLGVDQAQLVLGNGSNDILELATQAFLRPGEAAVYSQHAFAVYPLATQARGARGIEVPVRDLGHDLPAMRAAITADTRIVFVANPNNPTGTFLAADALEAFIDSVPRNVLIVLDEAYRELVTDPEVADGLETYGDRPNILVLRTMSKAWGLAGLRMGYLVAQPEVAAAIRKVLTPFSTSLVAQAAAIAALAQEPEVRRRCALVVSERDRVTEALRAMGADVPTSQANFVWLPLGDGAVPFGQVCESRGIIVRPFQGDGVRVTIGTAEENDAFLAAAEVALKS